MALGASGVKHGGYIILAYGTAYKYSGAKSNGVFCIGIGLRISRGSCSNSEYTQRIGILIYI